MAGMHKAVSERHGMTTIAALVAIVAMIFASVITAPQRAYAEEYNISDLGWVDKDDTSFEISSDGGKTWKPYISGMQVNYGDQIRTELHWKVPNDVKINEGDTFVYDLPGNLEYKSNEKYPIYNGGDVVGYYTIQLYLPRIWHHHRERGGQTQRQRGQTPGNLHFRRIHLRFRFGSDLYRHEHRRDHRRHHGRPADLRGRIRAHLHRRRLQERIHGRMAILQNRRP